MRMYFLLLLTVFPTVLVHGAENENEKEFLKRCPPFKCGNLQNLSFPLARASESSNCGPFTVDDCDQAVPKIKLIRNSDQWYLLHNFSQSHYSKNKHYNITISDPNLQSYLNSRDCNSFYPLKHSFPLFPGFPFSYSKFIKLIRCNRSFSLSSPEVDSDYKNCSDFIVYYNHINRSPPSTPPNCQDVWLPVRPDISHKSHHDVFQVLTATVSLQVFTCVECYLCPLNDGQCQQNNNTGQWRCLDRMGKQISFFTEPATQAWKWKLALGAGSVVILLCLMLMFFWHRYKMSKYSTRPNAYSSAFARSDLEGATLYFGVSVFSYSELQEATNGFASENELGDGGFGTVYYGKLKDGREVAVKRLYQQNYRKVEQFMNEIEILTQLRHTNLVSLYGCTSRLSRELLLVYEYIPNGTVADHLHGNRTTSCLLNWPIRLRIAIETATALAYLHASGIVHRDVKTSNILLDCHCCVKVADFGISRLFPSDVTHISTAPQGTPGYVDPDYYQCYRLTDKSDVYSFGVVLAELISSMPAVDISRHRHEINLANLAVNRIQKCELDEFIDPMLRHQEDEEVNRMIVLVAELAFLCLQQDREMRPAMAEVLQELQRIENRESQMESLGEVFESSKSTETSQE